MPASRPPGSSLCRAACTAIVAGMLLVMAAVNAAPAQSSSAGSASLAGAVLVEPSEKPLANAELVFTKLSLTTRTDSAGNFVIQGVPAAVMK